MFFECSTFTASIRKIMLTLKHMEGFRVMQKINLVTLLSVRIIIPCIALASNWEDFILTDPLHKLLLAGAGSMNSMILYQTIKSDFLHES